MIIGGYYQDWVEANANDEVFCLPEFSDFASFHAQAAVNEIQYLCREFIMNFRLDYLCGENEWQIEIDTITLPRKQHLHTKGGSLFTELSKALDYLYTTGKVWIEKSGYGKRKPLSRDDRKAWALLETRKIEIEELLENMIEDDSWYRVNVMQNESPKSKRFWEVAVWYIADCVVVPYGIRKEEYEKIITSAIHNFRNSEGLW